MSEKHFSDFCLQSNLNQTTCFFYLVDRINLSSKLEQTVLQTPPTYRYYDKKINLLKTQ